MDIKDFRKGQTVYILNMHSGSNREPSIHRETVVKIGKKYVTTGRGRRYESSDDPYSLEEKISCGDMTYLCPGMEYAQMYMERENLRQWLYSAAGFGKEYTLEQLREVKKILEQS